MEYAGLFHQCLWSSSPVPEAAPGSGRSRVLYDPAPEQEGKPQQWAASRRGGGGGEG